MVNYLDFPSHEQNEKHGSYFRAFNDWGTLPIALERPMPAMIFKRNLERFLGNFFHVSFMYTFLMQFLIFASLLLIFHFVF